MESGKDGERLISSLREKEKRINEKDKMKYRVGDMIGKRRNTPSWSPDSFSLVRETSQVQLGENEFESNDIAEFASDEDEKESDNEDVDALLGPLALMEIDSKKKVYSNINPKQARRKSKKRLSGEIIQCFVFLNLIYDAFMTITYPL